MFVFVFVCVCVRTRTHKNTYADREREKRQTDRERERKKDGERGRGRESEREREGERERARARVCCSDTPLGEPPDATAHHGQLDRQPSTTLLRLGTRPAGNTVCCSVLQCVAVSCSVLQFTKREKEEAAHKRE